MLFVNLKSFINRNSIVRINNPHYLANNNLNNNITTMLQTERQALHYKVIANTAHKVEKIARQLAKLYNDSYINNNEIDRNLKKLERYYDELKLYLDK